MDDLEIMYEIVCAYVANPNRIVYTIWDDYGNRHTITNDEAEMTTWVYRNWIRPHLKEIIFGI